MNKERLNELLDSIYELEGLVHLAISRDDSPAMLPELIRRKSREMVARAESVTTTETIVVQESVYISEPEPALKPELVLEPKSQPDPTFEPTPALEPEPESEPERFFVAEHESASEPELRTEEEFKVRLEDVESEARPMAKPEARPIAKPEAITGIKPEARPIAKPIDKPVQKETYAFEEYTEPKGRLVFSINDRYRFKRELFRGSDVDFNTTLSLVASMDGYDEAEDYFLNELQWDEKSPDVIDFLEILKNYFK